MDLHKIRRSAESFISSVNREYYLNGAGIKERMNTTRIYNKYNHLFKRETLDNIKNKYYSAGGEDKRRFGHLLEFLTSEYMYFHVKELNDRLAEEETSTVIEVDGNTFSFRHAQVMRSLEADRNKRQKLDSAVNNAVEGFTPIIKQKIQKLHSLSTELDYNNYIELCDMLKGINLTVLKAQMEKLLNDTEEVYIKTLDRISKKHLNIPAGELVYSDMAYLLRAELFDSFFPELELVPALEDTLYHMGINLDKQPNITLDLEKRKNKSPRAFCAALRVPREIVLVILPRGGVSDYQSLFHEGGHAEHFAHVPESLPMEYRYLGDNSVTETYAFLFECLTANPLWLERYLKTKCPEEYFDYMRFTKLYMVRRYAGKLLYELTLHENTPGDDMKHVYSQTLTKATGVAYPEEPYLYDLDDGFYCAQYLRAWILEAQLRSHLEQNLGSSWFQDREAGEFLKRLWSFGQRCSADELALELGYEGLDINNLISTGGIIRT